MAIETLPRRSQGVRRGLDLGEVDERAEGDNLRRSTSYIDAVQALHPRPGTLRISPQERRRANEEAWIGHMRAELDIALGQAAVRRRDFASDGLLSQAQAATEAC